MNNCVSLYDDSVPINDSLFWTYIYLISLYSYVVSVYLKLVKINMDIIWFVLCVEMTVNQHKN